MVSKFSPKAEPVVYLYLASMISAWLLKVTGIAVTPTAVLTALTMIFAFATNLLRSRVTPVHSNGTPVVTK